MRKLILLTFVVTALFSCNKDKKANELIYINGTYKAIEAEYNYGWKAYLHIDISEDELTSISFDYLDESGNKKSETTEEEYPMDPHPSIWLPQYESNLMNADIINFSDIDAISGATHTVVTINKMMKVLLEAAKTGDTSEKIISEE